MAPGPSRTEEVLAWMASTRQGPKAAAAHFGISHNTIKAMVQRARAKAPPGEVIRLAPAMPAAPPPEVPDPTTEAPLAFYMRKLQQLEVAISTAGPREAAPLFKQMAVFYERFHALQAEEAAKHKRNPRDGIDRLIYAVRSPLQTGGFPEAVVEEIEEAIAERRRQTG